MLSIIDRDLAQQIVNTVKDVCGHDVKFIDCSGMILPVPTNSVSVPSMKSEEKQPRQAVC